MYGDERGEKMSNRTLGPLVIFAVALLACAGCGRGKPPGFLGSGTLEATEVIVSAETPGQLLWLVRDEGDSVAAGDTLARIDVSKLVLQRRQLATSLDEIAAERAPVAQSIAQAKDNRDNLEKTFKRIAGLLEKKTATQQQYDDASTRYRVAESQLESAKAQEKLLDARDKSARASIAVLDRQIRDGAVISPLSGVITEKYVEQGEVVSPAGPVYKIADPTKYWLKVYVAERDLGTFKIGSPVSVRVDAYQTPLAAVVSWVSPEAEFTPKNVETKDARAELVYAVKVTLGEAPSVLKIGMPAEVYLPVK
jgi:HlyD family secretion protein